MNRSASLRWALPSWLAQPEVEEIVLVDWGSSSPLHLDLADFTDVRIRFIQVEGPRYWCAARCHNIEIIAASGENLLRIDSDVQITPKFFERHPLERDDLFWTTSWDHCSGNDCHLYGTVYSRRKNFLLVNGYNERLQSYGFEDDDIYHRMLAAGLKRGSADGSTMKHLPHDEASRLCHISPEFAVETELQGIMKNNQISIDQPWNSHSDHMTSWHITQASPNLWLYRTADS
jgi:hypothetical protein